MLTSVNANVIEQLRKGRKIRMVLNDLNIDKYINTNEDDPEAVAFLQ